MRRAFLGLVAAGGLVLSLPLSAAALNVTIDEILYQQDGSVNPTVLNGTADFSLSGTTLTIVLTNTSTGVTGGAAATNLLAGIGFTLPTGVSVLNNGGVVNSITPTGTSTVLNGTLTDATWGAGSGTLSPINSLTRFGDVNTAAATLQAYINFDLAGGVQPPANVGGPGYGLLSGQVLPGTAGGLAAVQNSVTITLQLSSAPAGLLDFINNNEVILAFGSPNAVPEPSTLLLTGTALLGVGVALGKRFVRRNREVTAAA